MGGLYYQYSIFPYFIIAMDTHGKPWYNTYRQTNANKSKVAQSPSEVATLRGF